MKVLNFGALNLDYVYQVEHFVLPGETISAKNQRMSCGGKGLNQSIALSRAGAEVFHAGCIGQGGDLLKNILKENGVDMTYLKMVDEIQGNAMIQVDCAGENCILLFGGSNQCITEEQIVDTIAQFEEGDFLIIQNEINKVSDIINAAYEQGMKIFLNPSPFDEKIKDVDMNKITWILINEVEAEQFSGSAELEETWKILHEKYPDLSVLITLGDEGSVCYTNKGCYKQESYPVKVVDTTAAGDTYTGYFIECLMEKKTIKESMKYAAASALSVTKEGAAPSIPARVEVNLYIRSN